jgi:hypothetical protein
LWVDIRMLYAPLNSMHIVAFCALATKSSLKWV